MSVAGDVDENLSRIAINGEIEKNTLVDLVVIPKVMRN